MYFKLNKKFTNSSLLNAQQLNDIVTKIIEIGGSLNLKFSNGMRLKAEYINRIIIYINSRIQSLPGNSGIELLTLSFQAGDSLCSGDLNSIINKINEIIDFLNNYKEDIYALYVKQKSISSTFPSTGGQFIVDAYITKNKQFFGTDGIQITSELSYTFSQDGTLVFTVPATDQQKTYFIKINSEYGEKEFILNQEAPISYTPDNLTLYVSQPKQIVSADGETVQYTVSIRKNGVNYTTTGIKSSSNYPYGISESFIDNGVERIYTVIFDENLSFNIKNYKSSISAYGFETQNINIQQEANTPTDIIKVYIKATKINYNYNDTKISYTFYARVNGVTITEGVIPEIISDDIGIVSTNISNGTAVYTINKNNQKINKQIKVKAKYNGVYSNIVTFTQYGATRGFILGSNTDGILCQSQL